MPKITGIMTAAAAVALLSLSPVAAQTGSPPGTGGGETDQQLGITQEERVGVRDWFTSRAPTPVTVAFDPVIGEPIPESVIPQLQPVPQEVVSVAPAMEGYHYFAMSDGRIAVVDAETHVLVDLIE